MHNLKLFVLADLVCLFLRLSPDQIQFYDQNFTFSSNCTHTSNIASAFQINASALEDEHLLLQSDIQMKAELLLDIFGTSMRENIPTSEDVHWTMTALFGLTYLCETAFSHMKITESKYRSTWTDDHLDACLKLASEAMITLAWLIQLSPSHLNFVASLIEKCLHDFIRIKKSENLGFQNCN